jgi:mono/diheme cytochrome c family protein
MKQGIGFFCAEALIGMFVALQPVYADDQPASAAGATAPVNVAAPVGGAVGPLYRVVDGDQVDAETLKGWKTWRSMACERCHGAAQEGMVGPSLLQSLKVLSKDEFKTAVLNGRIDKGMPNFGGAQPVVDNIDDLYAYLKGRSDGAIKPGHLKGIE